MRLHRRCLSVQNWKDLLSEFPERMYDVGIAEQHAATMAAGLATQGMKPFLAIYSTFLQRAYDQVLHDICRQNLNVFIGWIERGLSAAMEKHIRVSLTYPF